MDISEHLPIKPGMGISIYRGELGGWVVIFEGAVARTCGEGAYFSDSEMLLMCLGHITKKEIWATIEERAQQ